MEVLFLTLHTKSAALHPVFPELRWCFHLKMKHIRNLSVSGCRAGSGLNFRIPSNMDSTLVSLGIVRVSILCFDFCIYLFLNYHQNLLQHQKRRSEVDFICGAYCIYYRKTMQNHLSWMEKKVYYELFYIYVVVSSKTLHCLYYHYWI